MKHLLLIRHAKSSWNYTDVADRNRPLNERGIRNAIAMGQHHAKTLQKVEAIYSSPANRALHTATIIAYESKVGFHKLHIEESLYDFGGDNVLSFIYGLDDALQTVAIVGHNPVFTHIADDLSDTPIHYLPTAALVHITFEVESWGDLRKGKATVSTAKGLRP